jgi:hypothetical protein
MTKNDPQRPKKSEQKMKPGWAARNRGAEKPQGAL